MAGQRIRVLSSIFVVCLLFTPLAHAQEKITALTEENVAAFINATTEMTSGKNTDLSSEEISAYLDKHLDKDAHFKSSMKYNVPGFPAQESSISMEKADFIQSIQKGAESLADYESEIEIGKIKIARDGLKATVQTKGTERGVMPMALEGTTQHVPVEGSSSCNQIITLNEGVIQMFSAVCATVINFQGMGDLE